MEIVKLVGADVLPDDQKLVIEIAKVIRTGFLQQNAFHKDDTFVPLEKQYKMMKVILYLYKKAKQLVSASIPISKIINSGLFEKVIKIKYDVGNEEMDKLEGYIKGIDLEIDKIIKG